ncbi:MAG: signal peptidase I [Actinomycetota bacterium]
MMDDQSTHDAELAEASRDTGHGRPITGPPEPAKGAAVSADDPDGEPESGPDPGKRQKNRSFWRELPVLVIIALVIALVIKSFVVQAFYIPSPSMEHTLDVGDKVLVNKLVYHFRDIQPGDVVVFNGVGSWDPLPPPSTASGNPLTRLYDDALKPLFHSITGLFGTAPGQQDYIKRVIGVPGDRVACCTTGRVTVNGVPLSERSYLSPGDAPSLTHFSITVPKGRLWVMGDHRYVSYDSRGHMQDPGGGTIPESQVVGRAFMVVWPPSRWRILPIPATFGQPGVTGGKAAAAGATATAAAQARAASIDAMTVPVRSSAPYLPLELGFAGAVPLTWMQRRVRLRVRGRRRPSR